MACVSVFSWVCFSWFLAVDVAANGCSPLSYSQLIPILEPVLPSTEGKSVITSVRYNCFAYELPSVTKLKSFVVSVNGTQSSGGDFFTRINLACSTSGNFLVAIATSGLPFLEKNVSFDSYCADCLFESPQPCQACNGTCLKNRCHGPNATDCCNFFQAGSCVVDCLGNFIANGTQNDCSCVDYYTGSACDQCALTCQNGGTVAPNCSVCLCPSGFSGVRCEIGSHCLSSPCLNGGECADEPGQSLPYTCNCTENWRGSPTCSECSVPCLHGRTNANCTNCSCDGKWTGPACTVCSVQCEPHWRPTANCSHCECSGNWTGSNCSDCFLLERNDTCFSPCHQETYLPDETNTCYACGLSYCTSCDFPNKNCQQCSRKATLDGEVCIKNKDYTVTIVGISAGVVALVLILIIGGYCRNEAAKGHVKVV